MNIFKKAFLGLGFIVQVFGHLLAQNAIAVSSTPPIAPLHVALNWQPTPTAVAYQVFRRMDGEAAYPTTPLSMPSVKPAANCFVIRTLLISGGDSTNWKIVVRGLADSVVFNPCNINAIPKSSDKYDRLQLIARRNMRIAKTVGWAFEDNTVVLGKTYFYRIVAVDGLDKSIGIVATDLKVTAGAFTPPLAPSTVIAEAGDGAVQVRWAAVGGVGGYVVERSANPVGVFRRVNESQLVTKFKNKLNGDTLVPNTEGFLDFQRYDTLSLIKGAPVPHTVLGLSISGPTNGVTYYYRVRSMDIFNRQGAPSGNSNGATPRDSTPPSVANDLLATSDDVLGQVKVRWSQVTTDINGHREQPDSMVRYRLYRFPTSDNPNTTPSLFLGEIETIKGLKSKDTLDADPSLRASFGNRTWWYRLRSVDAAGNVSQWSAAVSAIVKDTMPPDIVRGVVTVGLETRIDVKWTPNAEPDVASYMVYRSLCHLGKWVECNPKSECKDWQFYNPLGGQDAKDSVNQSALFATTGQGRRPNVLPCPCSGGFVFLGEITADSVRRATVQGHLFFSDRTIPAGSPLCYAYWIKAKDSSDNVSGRFPIPSEDERKEIICQRLRDLTPPEAALIAGLHARDGAIKVEWMGPPTQDTRAYHVYRALGTDPSGEPPLSDYKWVGGTTIELPPVLPKILTAPYKPLLLSTCDRVSVQATPWMSQGAFEDKTVDPKKTYWYRVVGIDYDGNETPIKQSAAISTFTFSRRLAAAPVIDFIAPQTEPCGIVLQWTPLWDPSVHLGFIIFRSASATGAFTPIVFNPLTTNTFTDTQVVKGVSYWYRIGILMKNGRLSELTIPQNVVAQ